ncbi:MAG: hypothetical protein H7252_07455 [Cytophaga sp.]|nr:hypothetical protein [Undibacterium sp.]
MTNVLPTAAVDVKRIQVGCGPDNLLKDWWNVDIRDFDGIDEVMDVTLPWRFKDSLDYVFGEHFLEHLAINKAFDFLSHSNAAFREGGVIRLSTPSLEWVIATHFDIGAVDDSQIFNQTLAFNRAFYGWGHQFLYSKTMLTQLLLAAGFSNLTFFSYGQSKDSALSNIERHKGYQIHQGFPSVWIIEGTKDAKPVFDFGFLELINKGFLAHVNSGH